MMILWILSVMLVAPAVTAQEAVRCLIGLARGDSILVDLAWEPPIQRSTPNSVAFRPCPIATVALWHNHPGTRDSEPEYSCYLSQIDIREAIQPRAPLVQMVQVTDTVFCWWTRAQVAAAQVAAAHVDGPVMRPLPQQSVGRFHLWSALACASKPGWVVCSRPTS